MVRFQAARYVLDQIIGTPTERVEIKGDIDFRSMLADVVINLDGKQNDVVVIDHTQDYADDDEEQDDD
jgi:hypothetical protein